MGYAVVSVCLLFLLMAVFCLLFLCGELYSAAVMVVTPNAAVPAF
jgi:hypothetical protein